jgi:3,4-dihydroxy 2-butanone 4-phosphate synthase/GTP cyclohydrolase II
MTTPFTSIEIALEAIKKGSLVILIDKPDRENEGDFFIPADLATPEAINFMLSNGRGLLCVALDTEQAQRLVLPPMVPLHQNTETTRVNFTVSVNAKRGISSGVSAFDRAETVQILANPNSGPQDITKPGHVFPLVAHPRGLQARQGHTEAAVALASLGGFHPAGVICEILRSDGMMAKLPDLIALSKTLNIPIVSIADLEEYSKKHHIHQKPQTSVVQTSSAELPTQYGTFNVHIFRSSADGLEHSALIVGDVKTPMLTRIHSQCLTGDTFGSLLCDCGEQLHESMRLIQERGSGILLYLNQEGRGIGLSAKVQAYAKQKAGLDTVEANLALGYAADLRNYQVAADILKTFGIQEIELLTNNPDKECAIEKYGIRVKQRVALEIRPNVFNKKYLVTKKQKLGHQLDLV